MDTKRKKVFLPNKELLRTLIILKKRVLCETLTAERFDGHGMMLVLRTNAGAQTDYEHVPETDSEGHDPNKHTQDDVGQQVLEGRDAVRVRLAAPHVRRIGAVLETFKIARIKSFINKQTDR